MKTTVVKDLKEKSILVSREFNAPLEKVWGAYTESQLLDMWWGPSPWRAETKTMNFEVGGYWLYAMVSPENEKHYGRMSYTAIEPHKYFELEDSFCDENGTVNTDLPVSRGKTVFTQTANGTLVEFKISYQTEAEVLQLVEMGFEAGITMCIEQLVVLFKENKI
jgi:uncharacterized protein YndB with AHSA1/START domain